MPLRMQQGKDVLLCQLVGTRQEGSCLWHRQAKELVAFAILARAGFEIALRALGTFRAALGVEVTAEGGEHGGRLCASNGCSRLDIVQVPNFEPPIEQEPGTGKSAAATGVADYVSAPLN